MSDDLFQSVPQGSIGAQDAENRRKEKILKVHRVNDYARYIGAPELHPLVSVIHYDELEHCRHSLNNYDVYGMFIGDETLEELTYGLTTYDLHRHALMCVAPGQIGGKTDTGEEIHTKGWALLFDPELLNGTDLGRRMSTYTFFSYNTSEALLMSEAQRQTVVTLLEMLKKSLNSETVSNTLIAAHIGLILEYVASFYARQITAAAPANAHLLSRFEALLTRYYDEGIYRQQGLPTVRYCAQELFLSPNYFGDLIRQLTDDTASNIIRRFVMQRARQMLIGGASVNATATALGFDYPQHFSRMFKKFYGVSPRESMRNEK